MRIVQPYPVKASFRGVEFETDSIEDEGGRRVIVHEYPNEENWDSEDLGRTAEGGKIEGYLTEPDLARKREAMLAALRTPGPGSLYHPYARQWISVRVRKWKLSGARDALGRFGLSIEFVPDSEEGAPVRVTNTAGVLADTAQSLRDLALADYLDVMQMAAMPGDIRAVVDGYVQTAIAWIGEANALSFIPSWFDLRGLIASHGALPPGSFATIDTALAILSVVDGLTSVYDQRLDQAEQTTSGGLAPDIDVSPMDRYEPQALLMQALRDVTDIQLPRVEGGDGETAMLNGAAAAIESLVARSALGALAQNIASAGYPDRDSAMAARYDFAQRIMTIQETAANDGQTDIRQTLAELLRYVGEQFASNTDDLQPLDTHNGTVRRTALSVAFDLYGDPTRALELIDRNGALNGSFLPPVIDHVRPAS
ncbi:DNA circularization N-terminal domain-containing protein [Paraburkholderia tuberum]|uniref:Mu-like prophage DNA circulation protein n=1 Tax=Paraburkholderia tuberum TaxID=157910 RepID=A0A1H1JSR0_9BURK|nr:DNA circularization N-terminal domain-containing protein [Paraburkholderia tuberum]SDR52930.1 Mu-like prophage DNA circulation protein [Paraburkholderia tuberum]